MGLCYIGQLVAGANALHAECVLKNAIPRRCWVARGSALVNADTSQRALQGRSQGFSVTGIRTPYFACSWVGETETQKTAIASFGSCQNLGPRPRKSPANHLGGQARHDNGTRITRRRYSCTRTSAIPVPERGAPLPALRWPRLASTYPHSLFLDPSTVHPSAPMHFAA